MGFSYFPVFCYFYKDSLQIIYKLIYLNIYNFKYMHNFNKFAYKIKNAYSFTKSN